MTISMITNRQSNGSVDCGGAEVRAHCRHLATVVTIRGVIDAANVDWVGAYILRFILGSNPVVLDLSDVSHFAAVSISLLHGFDEDCRAAGVEWTLVAGPAISQLLHDGGLSLELNSKLAVGVRVEAELMNLLLQTLYGSLRLLALA